MKWPIIATLAPLTACGESVQGAPELGDNHSPEAWPAAWDLQP